MKGKSNVTVTSTDPEKLLKASLLKVTDSPLISRNCKRAIIVVVIMAAVLTVGYLIIQHVGIVNDVLFPQKTFIITKTNDGWENVDEEINFSSVFYNKSIVNDASSDGKITIIVLDHNLDEVMGPFSINPGESYTLEELANNQIYKLKAFALSGKYFININ